MLTSCRAGENIRGLVCGFPNGIRQGRCIVVLHGFVDDSRTSDGSGHTNVFVLGGFLATADDWIQFSDEWEDTCDREPKTLDWHMAEAFRIKGRYHWRNETDRDARIRELVTVVLKHTKYRVDCVVSAGNYDRIVKGRLPAEIDDPYFVCYYVVILAVAHYMNQANLYGKVDFIFDDQGPLGDRVARWYYWVKDHVPPEIQSRLGSTPIFRHDRDVLPLKAADMYAWQIRRHLAQEQPHDVAHNDNLDNLLSVPGVSCYVRPEDLLELVQSGGVLLKANCLHRN